MKFLQTKLPMIILTSTIFGGCGDQFMAKTSSVERSTPLDLKVDAAGNSSSTVTKDGGTLETAYGSVSFPPGALSVSTSVIFGVGQSLVTSTIGSELGVTNNSFAAGGNALAVLASTGNPAIGSPMTISVGFTPPSLNQSLNLNGNDNYVVIYRAIQADGKKIVGIIPSSDLTFKPLKVSFSASFWGVYQLAKVSVAIKQGIKMDSSVVPSLVNDPAQPAPDLTGTWRGECVQMTSTSNLTQTYKRTVFTFLNNSFSSTASVYETSVCNDEKFSNKTTGTFAVGRPFGKGFSLDIYVDISEASGGGSCVPSDSQNCSPDPTDLAARTKVYTIFQVEPQGPVLRFGTDINVQPNLDVQTRPSDLSTKKFNR